MFIGICSRSQVSVYRTIGPLVYLLGLEAKKLYNDAQAMLKKIIQNKSLKAHSVVAFYPANSIGDDIEVYDNNGKVIEVLHGLRQQVCLSVCVLCLSLSVCPCIHLSVHPSVCLSVHLSVCLETFCTVLYLPQNRKINPVFQSQDTRT